jgi:hypothetical protein
MKHIGKIVALLVLGVASFLSVSCANMDAGSLSNALGTAADNVTNSTASSVLGSASSVVGSTQPDQQ